MLASPNAKSITDFNKNTNALKTISWLGYSFTFLFFSILLLLSTLLHMSVEKEINFVINS